jgi:hypothetical protein
MQTMEISAAFNDPGLNLSGVRDAAAAGMFTLGSGRDIVRPFMESWSSVSQGFARQGHRSREIVAISRSDFAGVGHLKIVDLLKQAVQSPDEIMQRLGQLNARLQSDVEQRGDKRIRNAAQTSQAFIEGVARMGWDLTRGPNPTLQILTAMGADLSDIRPETTIDDIGRLSTFRKKLEGVNRLLRLPFQELKARVTAERLPSSVIQATLEKFRPDTREWKGSDLPDSYLASLVAYADVTFLDKRTHEALRQARPKVPELAAILKRFEKSGDYSAIAKIVAG